MILSCRFQIIQPNFRNVAAANTETTHVQSDIDLLKITLQHVYDCLVTRDVRIRVSCMYMYMYSYWHQYRSIASKVKCTCIHVLVSVNSQALMPRTCRRSCTCSHVTCPAAAARTIRQRRLAGACRPAPSPAVPPASHGSRHCVGSHQTPASQSQRHTTAYHCPTVGRDE